MALHALVQSPFHNLKSNIQITMTIPITYKLFYLVLLILTLFSSLTNSSAEEEFSYIKGSAKGPENWGNINPKWKVCGNGKLQSPIDLVDKRVQVSPKLCKLQRYYKPAPAVLRNMGHAIMLQWNGDAGQFIIDGIQYNLLQYHWHTPSEHTLNGSIFDLELHAFHQSSKGEMAVIGVWYKIGRPDPLLSKLLEHIKSLKEQDINLGVINPKDILFEGTSYYRYAGSLTTPPCTEGVSWTVVKKVRTVSVEQLNALKEAVHRGFEQNARPTLEVCGREVYVFSPEDEKEF
ncbi:PREDICTED: alpha carbonic anhydrase 4-like [Lupinus angustifolius]|uniref:alpha carbonic anhydrase 4-like n=1 Tax=Lupinus angustifolius TaxID=3871 RepID=UPI00092E7215|nr:PREDICTED: alpha carbonic anhydrase 4-like [Lupinus angustifolius]